MTVPTPQERRLMARLRTPLDVQQWLRAMPYNHEEGGETLRTLRGVLHVGRAHCLEAALSAATILEAHGRPPWVVSFESKDGLDHVIYLYRDNGRWGSVARSRDEGLHGRKAVFRTPRDLALSYYEPYVDLTGRIQGYAVVDLRDVPRCDWRFSVRNVWKVEQFLIDYPHRRIRSSQARYRRLFSRYKAWKARFPDRSPDYYRGQHNWL